MVVADALSRSFAVVDEDAVLKIHVSLNHRKYIKSDLQKAGFNISETKMRNILGKCKICLEMDEQYL